MVCDECHQLHLGTDGKASCVRHKVDGSPCTVSPMASVSVCFFHGKSPSIMRRVIAAKALKSLRVTTPAARENPLAELQRVGTETLDWHRAMKAKADALLADDNLVYLVNDEEKVRATVTLFERASDRALKAYEALAKLNIDERLMRIEEAKAAFIIRAVEAALEEAGLDISQREQVRLALDRAFT